MYKENGVHQKMKVVRKLIKYGQRRSLMSLVWYMREQRKNMAAEKNLRVTINFYKNYCHME